MHSELDYPRTQQCRGHQMRPIKRRRVYCASITSAHFVSDLLGSGLEQVADSQVQVVRNAADDQADAHSEPDSEDHDQPKQRVCLILAIPTTTNTPSK